MDQGFTLKNIRGFVQYIGCSALEPFVRHVTTMRVEAEKSGLTTKGNTAKVEF